MFEFGLNRLANAKNKIIDTDSCSLVVKTKFYPLKLEVQELLHSYCALIFFVRAHNLNLTIVQQQVLHRFLQLLTS